MNDPSTFERFVLENCQRDNLFPKDSKVLLALSGGPDSTALVHVLSGLSAKLNISLGVAHLNHQMRGEESNKDAEFVQILADEFHLPCHVKAMDVKDWAEREGYSFQEGARKCRQQFFSEIAREHHYTLIALGHHQDDQAETVIMNILRGSGLQGLGGILGKSGLFVRPLLNCSRQEILDYLGARKATFREDSSNLDTSYLRNKVRLELIPHIKSDFAPRFKEQLGKMAQLLQWDESFLSEEAQKFFQGLSSRKGSILTLPAGKLKSVHPAILNRVLRFAIQEIKGDLRSVEFDHVQQVCQLLSDNSVGACVLPGDTRISLDKGDLVFSKLNRNAPDFQDENLYSSVLLQIPGETWFEPGKVTFRAKIQSQKIEFNRVKPNQAFLDLDSIGNKIEMRCYLPGDKFWPLGAGGRKKLKEWFIDRKIPKEARPQIPVLTDGSGNIIWVYGHQISETVKIQPETKRVLCLEGFE
ncbi:MAG: tRNA lysidine(34) synthetase TilS [Candidatus Nitronauta litoralis]|uniref:tRNA(Ile)-lysidine synthase n=1 Tax=Candidatus Nitronauta litoralis TaxID=2705533 RepID=A0A7T0BYW3_9BACT|nr:MAG: tRNA lysidine(34) synthetase TilS [Candidatus Nitronauta litoralis]